MNGTLEYINHCVWSKFFTFNSFILITSSNVAQNLIFKLEFSEKQKSEILTIDSFRLVRSTIRVGHEHPRKRDTHYSREDKRRGGEEVTILGGKGYKRPFDRASIPDITPGRRHVHRLDIHLAWRDVSAVFSAN